MYMAVISGWNVVVAFSEDEEKAKKLAVGTKKKHCVDDLEKWNWKECKEFYGAYVKKVEEGTVIYDL